MDFLKFSSLAILCFISFLIGYNQANEKCKVTLQDLEIKSNNVVIQQLEKEKNRAEKTNEILTSTQENVYENSTDVENQYNLLNSANLFNGTDWVHSDGNGKASTDLSDSATTSGSTKQETQCRCPQDNRAELQRVQKLYEAELKKAKECDLAVVQLNGIIEYYNKIRVTFSE